MSHSEALQELHVLVQQRFSLLKTYPVLSVEAMECLGSDDVDGFSLKLDERARLTEQVDQTNAKIDEALQLLDEESGALVKSLLRFDFTSFPCPDWGKGIARGLLDTQKLLQNCALLDARLNARAKALGDQIRAQLGRTRAQRKIDNSYSIQAAAASGVHIRGGSK
jgi:hypothetical protein